MKSESFSPYVIQALVDVISGGAGNDNTPPIGIYRSGPKIESLMMECNLDFRVGSQSRVPALRDFLRWVSIQPEGFESISKVILRVSDPREYTQYPEKGAATVEHLNKVLEVDSYEIITSGGTAILRRRGSSGAVIDRFTIKAVNLDFDTVDREIKRALESADTDPEDAVTAACSLSEAVCRSILIELGLELPAKKDIDGLIRAVQEPLGLSPGRTDIASEIAVDVKQILSGLTSVAKGIGALRTHGGDAHGRERGFVRIDSRIARLSIYAASTLALFLIETWEQKFRRTLPMVDE